MSASINTNPILCSVDGCKKEGVNSMSDGEYHYCTEHYDGHIIGECEDCGIEIHKSWDCAVDCCRPCGKNRSHEEKEETYFDCDLCGEEGYENDYAGCCNNGDCKFGHEHLCWKCCVVDKETGVPTCKKCMCADKTDLFPAKK